MIDKNREEFNRIFRSYRFAQFTIPIVSTFIKFLIVGLFIIPLWKIAYGGPVALNLFNIFKLGCTIFFRGLIPLALFMDAFYALFIAYNLNKLRLKFSNKKKKKHGRRK